MKTLTILFGAAAGVAAWDQAERHPAEDGAQERGVGRAER